jgi:Tfp pilus assembly protein PilX
MKTKESQMKTMKINPAERSMSFRRQSGRLASLVALMLVTLLSVAIPAAAQSGPKAVTLANLAGSWKTTIVGQGSCGIGAEVLVFTLNSTGSATDVAYTAHTVECGNQQFTDQLFTITSLSSDGSGTAEVNINGAVRNFTVQVSPNHQVFSLVDVTDVGHYQAGTGILQ